MGNICFLKKYWIALVFVYKLIVEIGPKCENIGENEEIKAEFADYLDGLELPPQTSNCQDVARKQGKKDLFLQLVVQMFRKKVPIFPQIPPKYNL